MRLCRSASFNATSSHSRRRECSAFAARHISQSAQLQETQLLAAESGSGSNPVTLCPSSAWFSCLASDRISRQFTKAICNNFEKLPIGILPFVLTQVPLDDLPTLAVKPPSCLIEIGSAKLRWRGRAFRLWDNSANQDHECRRYRLRAARSGSDDPLQISVMRRQREPFRAPKMQRICTDAALLANHATARQNSRCIRMECGFDPRSSHCVTYRRTNTQLGTGCSLGQRLGRCHRTHQDAMLAMLDGSNNCDDQNHLGRNRLTSEPRKPTCSCRTVVAAASPFSPRSDKTAEPRTRTD